MKSIWKFRLRINNPQNIEMPKGAEILSAHLIQDCLYVWAKVDPEAEKTNVSFRICGTGDRLPEIDLIFVGTVIMDDGRLVFHVFHEPNKGE